VLQGGIEKRKVDIKMEMGKLTAKLRDAVPVCLLVEGKEIKRYRNIEIPNDIKKLEYQDFKFDVPLNGAITFKIMFEPGVLPEEFPQVRERKTRNPLAKEAQLQEAAPEANAAVEAEFQQQPPQDVQSTEALSTSAVEALTQTLEDAQATREPVVDIAVAMVDSEAIKAEINKGESEGQLVFITVEQEAMGEAEAQPDDNALAKKLARKRKKGVTATEDESK
jgi:hypothetical protein